MRPSLTALNNEINTEVQNAVINASMPLLIKTHHLEGKHDDEYESRCPLCEVKRQKGRYQKDGIWYYANGEVIEWDEDLEAPFENLDEMTNTAPKSSGIGTGALSNHNSLTDYEDIRF
jgi:hypothetical protein